MKPIEDYTDEELRIAVAKAIGHDISHADLNAMHEAEKTAFTGHPELWAKYIDEELPKACQSETENWTPPECATARQRAIAFLRAVGE